MFKEPSTKRAIAFFDGQNLFHNAKHNFGYSFPNYDVHKLASMICSNEGWNLEEVRFYTGVHSPRENKFWNTFWSNKLAEMGRQGIETYTGRISFGQEKGVDVRLAIDVIKLARLQLYDVAIIFSQDQDLVEAALEIREIAKSQSRWIKIVSAYPYSNNAPNKRGIDHTDWIKIDKADYDKCIDPKDYR